MSETMSHAISSALPLSTMMGYKPQTSAMQEIRPSSSIGSNLGMKADMESQPQLSARERAIQVRNLLPSYSRLDTNILAMGYDSGRFPPTYLSDRLVSNTFKYALNSLPLPYFSHSCVSFKQALQQKQRQAPTGPDAPPPPHPMTSTTPLITSTGRKLPSAVLARRPPSAAPDGGAEGFEPPGDRGASHHHGGAGGGVGRGGSEAPKVKSELPSFLKAFTRGPTLDPQKEVRGAA